MGNTFIQQLEQQVASLQAAPASSTQLVDALNELAHAYYSLDIHKGLDTAGAACQLARHLLYPQGEADSLINLSWLLIQDGKLDSAYVQAEHALFIANQLGDKRRQVQSTHMLAVIHYEAGNYQKAESFWLDLLAKAREAGDRRRQADYLTALGILHQEQSNLALAYDHKRLAHEIYVELDDPNQVISLNNLAYLLTRMGQHDKALMLASEALRRCSIKSQSWRSMILHTLGLIHLHQQSYEEARRLFDSSITLSLHLNKQQAIRSLIDLAKLEWECHNRPDACNALTQALEIADEIKSIKLQGQAHQCLYRYYLQMKAYAAASRHHEQSLACDHALGCKRMEKQVQIMRANATVLNAKSGWSHDSRLWLRAA